MAVRVPLRREQQTSHAYLEAELLQLQSMSQVLPPVFLLVAAFLVNITLSRLIALEREQIGLMKALGYSSWAVARHYVEFVLVIALFGIVIGFALGYWLGNELTRVYAQFYTFPLLIFSRALQHLCHRGPITIGVGGVRGPQRRTQGCLAATGHRHAAAISPDL
jgi:putative ABC transport system permease protein